MRAAPDRRAEIAAQFATWTHLDIKLFDVDYEALVQLAGEFGLTTYDASYLWLARAFGVELVTLDPRLARAAST